MVKSQKEFDLLYNFIRENDNVQGSYASWVFTSQSDKSKPIISTYHDDLISWLPETKTNGILRSMLRSVAQFDVPKNSESEWIDVCFHYLISIEYEIAVKVHAMQILANYCKLYPELNSELILVIETGMESYSSALKARARGVLKSIKK